MPTTKKPNPSFCEEQPWSRPIIERDFTALVLQAESARHQGWPAGRMGTSTSAICLHNRCVLENIPAKMRLRSWQFWQGFESGKSATWTLKVDPSFSNVYLLGRTTYFSARLESVMAHRGVSSIPRIFQIPHSNFSCPTKKNKEIQTLIYKAYSMMPVAL